MQAVHKSRMYVVEPAQQGGSGVVLKYFFGGPQSILIVVGLNPEYVLCCWKPLLQAK